MNQDELNALPEKVIGCAYNMGNKLGCGFLEKVYICVYPRSSAVNYFLCLK